VNTETSSPLKAALMELSPLYPEMRFGQLVEMVALLSSEETPMSAAEVDDNRLVEAATRHASVRRQRLGIADEPPQERPLSGPRDEVLEVVLQACERHPDWRFGFLVEHLGACSGARLYDAEDEQLIEAARRDLAG